MEGGHVGGVVDEIFESRLVPWESVRRELFGGATGHQGSTFKDFMDCKPPKYRGCEKVVECLNLIMKMEQTFRLGDFTER